MVPWFKPTVGGGVTIVDDAEDQDFTEYSVDTDSASIVTSNPIEGNASMKLSTPGTQVEIHSEPGDGLNYYPESGDTFRLNVRFTKTGSLFRGMYAVDSSAGDPPATYFVRLETESDTFELERNDGGGGGTDATIASTTQAFSTGIDYEVEVQWGTDGVHTATAFDDTGSQLAQISGTDSTYTSGGIGWIANGLSTASEPVFDYMRVL